MESLTPKERRQETLARILLFVAGGLLLATMVSCSCNPVR